jgi:hypothetical protein
MASEYVKPAQSQSAFCGLLVFWAAGMKGFGWKNELERRTKEVMLQIDDAS